MRRTALAAVLLAAGLALAGCATPAGNAPDSSVTSSTSETANDVDRMFAAMMLPHHEQAIEMSDMLLAKSDVDARVVALAERIKAEQQPEIEQLQGWLDAWGVAPTDGMSGMSGMDHGDGMMSDDDMAALEAAPGAEAGALYLEQMIRHHEGAVEMAQAEVQAGADADVVALAESIVESQTAEIDEMQALLAEL